MKRTILVTGTDTGVGKTVVTCAILRALLQRGLHPFPIKPVETGCDDLRRPEDAIALSAAAGGVDLATVCPVRYQTPASPWTAARLEGSKHSFEGLVDHIRAVQQTHDLVIVEGAGGLLVPIAQGKSYADLAVAIGASLIVVARDALGTLNHTSLTLEAALSRGIPVSAVVLNAVASPDRFSLPHGDELRALWPGVLILDPIPRRENPHSILMSNESSIAFITDMTAES